jgi:hypothetical protein
MTQRIVSLLPLGIVTLLVGCSGDTEVFDATNAELTARVGDPCVLRDEARPEYAGTATTETIVEETPECGQGVCMSYGFQGRVTCPEGNDDPADPECLTTDGEPVVVAVEPQLPDRPAEDAVICSCRCDGPAGEGPFCDCPDGFACQPDLFDEFGSDVGRHEAGGYCVKSGD